MTRPRKRLLPACAAALLALGAAVLNVAGAGGASAATPSSQAVATMMLGYNSSTGLIGNFGWGAAVSQTTLATYMQTTGDPSYTYALAQSYAANKASNFENDYLDDTGWWSLAWIKAYDLTGNPDYLNMARTEADYIHGYWDSTCGGGVWWSAAKGYKNAITNELFLQITAALHNRIYGDTQYLGWANAEWAWFNGSGMINGSHLVNDGPTSGCANNGQPTYTYNQGVILAGLAELSRATGNTSYVSTARSIADAAISALSTNGILHDPGEQNSGGDGDYFKGAFVRGLRQLATAASTSAYDAWLQNQASSIQTADTNSSSQIGLLWSGPIGTPTKGTQASGVAALVSALPVPPAGALTSGITGKCADLDHASTADGSRVQLWSCNGSPAQIFRAYPDGSLRVFGTCVDATNNGTVNATKLQVHGCNGSGAQQWVAQSDGSMKNPQSGRCMDDPNSSTTDGTQLQLWDCNGSPAQKFAIAGAPTSGTGGTGGTTVVGAVISAPGGKCVDVAGNDTAGNAGAVQLWDCQATAADQHWTASAGSLKTLGRCLDVTNNGTANGALLELWDCTGGGAQQWVQLPDGSLKNPQSGRCMDSPNGSTVNGARLQIWDCNASAAQKFSIPGGTGASGVTTVSATSTIQAESASAQSGTQAETTADVGGGQNVGWIGNGDWLQFNGIDFGSAGLHTFSARLASAAGAGGSVEVHLDSLSNPSIGSISLSSTGGWQSWKTVPATITSTTGTHTVFLKFVTASGSDFANINWLTFS